MLQGGKSSIMQFQIAANWASVVNWFLAENWALCILGMLKLGMNPSSLQCCRCRKNIQDNAGGVGTKRYLSTFDVVQGQGNGQVRGGSAQNFLRGLTRVDEPGIGRNWDPLEPSSGQNNGVVVQPVARGLFNESRIGKNWTPLDLDNIQNPGGIAQHSARGHSSKPGNSKNWTSPHGLYSGFVNLESPRGQDSPSKIHSHLLELESRVRWLRSEYTKQKKAMSHLATFVQLSTTEIHNGCSKMKEYFEALAGKMDNSCPYSRDISTQINSLHNSLKMVESKIDGLRFEARNNEENFGAVHGSKEKTGHQCSV